MLHAGGPAPRSEERQPVDEKPEPMSLRPLLVPAPNAAKLLSISERTLRKLNCTEQVPRPARLGRRVLWSVVELEEWIAAGCPPRHRWESSRAQSEKSRRAGFGGNPSDSNGARAPGALSSAAASAPAALRLLHVRPVRDACRRSARSSPWSTSP